MEVSQDYSSPENVFSGNLDEGLFGETVIRFATGKGGGFRFINCFLHEGLPVNLDAALYRFGGDRAVHDGNVPGISRSS